MGLSEKFDCCFLAQGEENEQNGAFFGYIGDDEMAGVVELCFSGTGRG